MTVRPEEDQFKSDVWKDNHQVSRGGPEVLESPACPWRDGWTCCPAGHWDSPPICPRMLRRSELSCRAQPMAKATNWRHMPQFQGKNSIMGSYHKKELSWLISGFWIKGNTFKVRTQTLGPREQPVPMPGTVGGSQLTKTWAGTARGTPLTPEVLLSTIFETKGFILKHRSSSMFWGITNTWKIPWPR